MTQEHTPGPWGFMGTAQFGFAIENTMGTVLADNIKFEYDARLMMAAPDLLAALKEARYLLKESDFISALVEDRFDAGCRQIDSAIAKARKDA